MSDLDGRHKVEQDLAVTKAKQTFKKKALTIRKLTYKNPTMKAKFNEARLAIEPQGRDGFLRQDNQELHFKNEERRPSPSNYAINIMLLPL